jgi:hypothetical protein
MVVSASSIGAHNTAVHWALHSLGAETVLRSISGGVIKSFLLKESGGPSGVLSCWSVIPTINV